MAAKADCPAASSSSRLHRIYFPFYSFCSAAVSVHAAPVSGFLSGTILGFQFASDRAARRGKAAVSDRTSYWQLLPRAVDYLLPGASYVVRSIYEV